MTDCSSRAGAPYSLDAADNVFRESAFETAERMALGVAWRLKPERIAELPSLLRLHARELVRPRTDLPDAEATLSPGSSVVGIAHDLSVGNLVAAYERGLYPHSHVLTPKWHSPAMRCVMFYPEFHVSKRLRAHLRQGRMRVTFDRGFADVMRGCAARRGRLRLTWITPRIMTAFSDLHDAGYAHSFEVWNGANELIGGGYGIGVGKMFSLESMFCIEDNASKIGFTVLNWHLQHWGFAFTDNKSPAPYKTQMGFKSIPRAEFLEQLAAARGPTKKGKWQVEADASVVAAWRPAEGN